MILALTALLGAALTAAACYAAGAMLIDRLGLSGGRSGGLALRRCERIPLAFTLGAACLHLAIFAILALQIAYWPVLTALLLGVIASAVATGSWRLRGEPDEPLSLNLKRVCIPLFGLFTLLYFFHAWAPEISPDGSGYHLGYVSRYLRAHGFELVTTDMYATLSEGIEMLFVPAFAIGKHSAAALVHLAFMAALALAMFAYGRRLGKPWVGAAGAFLTYASPVVGIDGSSAYNDVGVAAVVFSAFYWLEIWDETRQVGELPHQVALIPVGLMAGFCYATKYTAFVMLLFALGFVAWRARKLRPVVTVVLLSSLMVAPWMLKNWIIVRNPIAPFGNAIFRNPYFHPIFEKEYSDALRSYEVKDKRTLPLEVTIRGEKTQGILGLTFLAAPLALLALRYRHGRRLLAAALLTGLPYYFNIGTRFLIPPLPFISLAMALGIGSRLGTAPPLLAALMIFHAVSSWPAGMHRYADKFVWGLNHIMFNQALRLIPQEQYLRKSDVDYGAARLVEATVPQGERILGLRGVPYAYCNREILSTYQSALSQTLIDFINISVIEDYQPTIVESFKFPERSARRFRVLQTATVHDANAQWSVHELRFFHRGIEIPRRPEWRLQAWSNPWEVQLAFDNSLATRWRTWETVKPGDYLDVDFETEQKVDEVRLDTSPDYFEIRLQVEALDSSEKWILLAQNPKAVLADRTHYSLRRAATYEIKARGIHYLLTDDDDFRAEDIRDDPEAWGLTEVATGFGIRIYKVSE
jgi:hypothetical protein